MTNSTYPSGSGDEPEISDAALDSMLKGHRPLEGAPEAHTVADVMNALTAPPERTELAGYSQAMDTYGRAFARPRSRRVAMISSAAGLKALASAAGAAVALGGVATIVFASGAMGPAHQTMVTPVATSATNDASKTTPKDDKTGTPVGPDASGPAAFGLCNAWSHHQANGAKPTGSIAFRNLATAAGGESKIAAYCAKIPHPGNSNRPTGKATGKATGKPTGKPTAKGTDKGTDKPAGTGTGKPTTLPTPTTTATLATPMTTATLPTPMTTATS
jgi:hypothetical protein